MIINDLTDCYIIFDTKNWNIKLDTLFNLLFVLVALCVTTTSCLYSGLDELNDSSAKELTAVTYTYRFLYNDTIKKGTPNQDIQIGRVCEVVFNKKMDKITEGNLTGFQTTLTYNVNCVQKSGPTGSVTKDQLFNEFEKLIKKDGLTNLWVYMTISDVATLTPLNNSPKLGSSGDFSKDCTYQVKAADGSTKDYIIKTVKSF